MFGHQVELVGHASSLSCILIVCFETKSSPEKEILSVKEHI